MEPVGSIRVGIGLSRSGRVGRGMNSPAKGRADTNVAGSEETSAAVRRKSEGPPALDRTVQAQIGDKLRAMYGELVEQPMPDRFASILDRLSKGEP